MTRFARAEKRGRDGQGVSGPRGLTPAPEMRILLGDANSRGLRGSWSQQITLAAADPGRKSEHVMLHLSGTQIIGSAFGDTQI